MIAEIVQFVVAMAVALALAYGIGLYMSLLIKGEPRPFEYTLSRIEGAIFRVAGIQKDAPMTWRQYLRALLLTNGLVMVFEYLVLTLQGTTPDLAFNTATSFATNTNLQHYVGESLSVLSQLSLMVAHFIAPASGFAACFAFLRCFHFTSRNVGNFYVDMTRAITEKSQVDWVAQIPLGRLGSPDDVAAAACYLASDEAAYITGHVLAVNGGMNM